MALNPEVKAKWIEALRSGKYAQAPNALRKNGGYCCLGVLCDVVKDDVGGKWEKLGVGDWHFLKMYSTLPDKVRILSGITQKEDAKLMRMNDDEGKNFSEIADYIEKNL